jgi:DNA polymerase
VTGIEALRSPLYVENDDMGRQYSLFDDPPEEEDFGSVAELVDHMMEMTDDPLASAGTNMVVYRGSPDAELMIIGEAPGTEEDRQGKPFVGRSGQLLDQMLGAVNLDPTADVFITNAVFRLPPGEGGKPLRKPTSDEIQYYKPFLLELIRLVDPVVMILMGNVATEAILDRTGITKLRGQWFEWDGRWALPMFHPAYLLRNPSRQLGQPKALSWQDLQSVREKLNELKA